MNASSFEFQTYVPCYLIVFFPSFAASEIHLSLAAILVDDQTLVPGNTYKAWVADATSFDLFAFTNDFFMPQTNTQRFIHMFDHHISCA